MTIESFFRRIFLVIVLFLNLGLGLAIFGYFKLNIIIFFLLFIFLTLVLYFAFKTFIKEKVEISKFEIFIIGIIIFITLFNILFYHDMSQDREDMEYIAATSQLVESGSLSFEDPLSYPYKSFINLKNDIFTLRYLPGYTVYLAIFNMLFGLQSVFWANGLLIFPSLILIYFIGKELSSRKVGLISILLFSTSYIFFWFPRKTISDNLLMFLLLFGSWLVLCAFKNKKLGYLFLALPIFSFSTLVRGEAMAYLITFILVLLFGLIKFKKEIKKNLQFIIPGLFLFFVNIYLFQSYLKLNATGYIEYVIESASNALWFIWGLNYITLFFILLGVMMLFIIYYLYKNKFFIIKERKINLFRKIFLISISILFLMYEFYALHKLATQEYIKWNFFDNQYVLLSFIKYYLIIYVLIILYGIYKQYFSKVVYALIFIFSPAFIFFKTPQISADQPWFMKRFYAITIPLLIILSCIVIKKIIKNRKKLYTITLILIIINLSISLPILAFKENQGVNEQLEYLSNNFDNMDLVLMKPGWQWQKWGYSLHYAYGLNVLPNVNGYKKKDFPEILKKYNNIYIISDQRFNIYPGYEDDNTKYLYEWKLNYSYLEKNNWLANYIYSNEENLEINKLKEGLKNIPSQKIKKNEEIYYIFQVKNKTELDVDKLFEYNKGNY